MAMSGQNRRRTLIVNKPVQGRLIFAMSILPAIGMTVLMLMVAYFCHQLSLEVMVADIELESVMPLYLSVAAFVMVSGIFLFYNAVKFSNRIAGPSHRLCQSMKRIRCGDVSFRVQLRHGDHLQELSEELNLLLDHLNDNPPEGSVTRDQIEREKRDVVEPMVEPQVWMHRN